ncbi:hypothetical protein [Flavobacterium sp. 5]|uniref:hypothetical protein n=1 Tax=Flavobacterium sp. 5 TaxID=2035199 RepID=UPI000CB6744F|nr:hypothetical protein [Flavobacterium sp. 5]PKB16539.1 hypothetical protein CLU82_1677 [Flavobacterium sp. 5]
MKRIKNYSLTIAILLITIGGMAILYLYGFHKEFDKKNISQNADGIIMVDIKNIRNHFVFSYLKNPSVWEFSLNNSEATKRFDVSNYGIEPSDYLAFFHIQNQPLNQWCFVAKIENETKFNKALVKASFAKTKNNKSFICYYSKIVDACIIQYANQILFCKNASNNQQFCLQIAEDLFEKHNYFDSKKIEKTIKTPNAITIWIKKNNLLDDNGIINISLKEGEIVAEGQLNWKPKYEKLFPFVQNSNTLLSLGFNFEMIQNEDILKNHSVQINKIIGFDLDSILAHHPTQTELVLHNIIEKKDSAITYDYDDDFNPIKKVIVHTNREPAFYFSVQTENSQKVYDYLKVQNIIDDHEVFTNFPLAITKSSVENNSFTLQANLPKDTSSKYSTPKIGYLQINLNRLQPKDWQFLIAKNKNIELLKPFESLQIELTQKNNLGYFQACIKTKKDKNLLKIIK